jgi:acetolactate synthase-1/2/3 large subunit
VNVGSSIIKNLEGIGVGHIFGGAGEANAEMLLELKKSERINTIIVKNEQAASFMACGYAMFSDNLGVCVSTAGPGEFNLFSGLAVALSDSLPVLAISGFVPKDRRGKGALNEATGLHRTPDSQRMFEATTKKTFIIDDPDATCDILEEAVNLAFEGRPGPVHIHLPTDTIVQEITNHRQIRLRVDPVEPDPAQLERLASVLADALRNGDEVMAIIGYGAIRSHAEQDVLAFVDRFQIPFSATMDAKGVLPEDHPLSLGGFGTSGDAAGEAHFARAKVVIAMGNSFAQNASYAFREDLFEGKRLLHINIDANEIGKVYPTDLGLLSDVGPAVRGLDRLLRESVGTIAPKTLERERFVDQAINASGDNIHPALLVREISRLLPERSVIMGDAGGHMLWLNCYLHLTKGQVYQNPGSFGPMASNVNGAIGVKCADPERTVVVGCGDGAYLMAGFEFMTAVQYKIPVVWVIFNNGGFNVIKQFQEMHHGAHAFTEFPSPDYAMYAKACGGRGYRVERLQDFAPVFQGALQANEPALIDVALDADVYPPYKLK